MKCSKCGHEHDTSLDYCPYCESNTHPPNITTPEQAANKEKLNFFFLLPVISVLAVIFPPFSTIAAIILLIIRFVKTKDKPRKRKNTIIYTSIIAGLIILFVSWVSIDVYLENKPVNDIIKYTQNGDFEAAQAVINKQNDKGNRKIEFRLATSDCYAAQGKFDQAAEVLIDYIENSSLKSFIGNDVLDRLRNLYDKTSDSVKDRINHSYASIDADKAAKEQERQTKAEKARLEQETAEKQKQEAAEKAKQDAALQEQQKAEAAKKAEAAEAAQKKQQEEAAANAQANAAQKAEEDYVNYISSCNTYSYDEISRNYTQYVGKKVVYYGEVSQILSEVNGVVTLSLSITPSDYGIWTDPIIVVYQRKNENEPRILEDDFITVYGSYSGLKEYKRVITGGTVMNPTISAQYISWDSPSIPGSAKADNYENGGE